MALRERRDGRVSALLMVGVRNIVLCDGDVNVGLSVMLSTFEMTCDAACELSGVSERTLF